MAHQTTNATKARRLALCAALGVAAALTPTNRHGEVQTAQAQLLMSRSKERQLGAQEHPNMLREFGGAYADDKISGYVAQVGGRMAANSEWPNDQFTMTLLNSSVINAFALPGGYVYISRQLLALMNSEAELASVLGHEVGHVTGRHSAKRYDRQVLSGLGAVLLGIGVGALTGSGDLGRLAGQSAQSIGQMATLSFSREQEFRADASGVRYLQRAGYDPYAAADMLRSLGAQSSLDARILGRDAESRTPTWARTHPLTADRVSRATKLAQDTKVAPGAQPRFKDRFLQTIDGLLVDDDANEGFVRGRTFAHIRLMLTFTAPEGFALQNSSTAVMIAGQNAQALFSGGGLPQNEPLANHIQRVWQGLAGQQAPAIGAPQLTTINGLDAAVSAIQVNSQRGPLNVAIVAYRWNPTTAYHFVIMTPAEISSRLDPAFQQMINSMRRLSADEAARFDERRLRLATVGPRDTADSLSKRMAYESNQLERFLVLNQLNSAADLKSGQTVKLVVYEKPRPAPAAK
jgi:predicted Zn-dependent protease